jgi:hypothetical protein
LYTFRTYTLRRFRVIWLLHLQMLYFLHELANSLDELGGGRIGVQIDAARRSIVTARRARHLLK